MLVAVLLALPAMPGAPLAFDATAEAPERPARLTAPPAAQETRTGRSGPLAWEAPESLADEVAPLADTAAEEIRSIAAWLGIENVPTGTLLFVRDRAALEEVLGREAPEWFAAVTEPGQRRIVIAVRSASSRDALFSTFRHELVHWVMIGLGPETWQRLPAWFHEGVAETWSAVDPLGDFNVPLGWRSFTGDLAPLSRFRDGFGEEPLRAAEGYALGHAFVSRLVRIHGDAVLPRLMHSLMAGSTLDAALVDHTGKSLITHEEELREELSSLGRLLGEMLPNLFLFSMLAALLVFPFLWRARRRRRAELESRWAREDAALDEDPEEEDDRWLHLG